MDLAVECLLLCPRIPRVHRTGIVSQLRRSATSIPLNIAEGHGRAHDAEYLHSLYFARGSLQETETMLEIIRRAGLVSTELITEMLKTPVVPLQLTQDTVLSSFTGSLPHVS